MAVTNKPPRFAESINEKITKELDELFKTPKGEQGLLLTNPAFYNVSRNNHLPAERWDGDFTKTNTGVDLKNYVDYATVASKSISGLMSIGGTKPTSLVRHKKIYKFYNN